MTNEEKIRSLTHEELAEWLTDWVEPCHLCSFHQSDKCKEGCNNGRSAWLKEKFDKSYF